MKDVVDCIYKVSWKRPEAYRGIVSAMHNALTGLREQWPDSRGVQIASQHSSLEARLGSMRVKLQSIGRYRQATIVELEALQGLVQTLVSLSIARSHNRRIIKQLEALHTHRLEEIKRLDQEARKRREQEGKNYQDELENRRSVSIALVGLIVFARSLCCSKLSP
jgi:hypothetical protein